MNPQKIQPDQPTTGGMPEVEAKPSVNDASPPVTDKMPLDASSIDTEASGSPAVTSPSTQKTEDFPDSPSLPISGMTDNPLPVSPPQRRNKTLLFGLIIAAVILLLTGGAAASYYYSMVNKPENVLKQALANSMDLQKAKTIHMSGKTSIQQKDSETPIEVEYKIAGNSETGAFDVNGTVDMLISNVTFDLRSTDSKTFYVRMGGLEGVSQLLAATGEETAALAPIITSLDNQWIEINDSFLKQIDKTYESAEPLTQADIQKITEAYLQHSFLVIKNVLADETVGGKDSYRYKIVVDPAKLKSFLAAVKDAKLDSLKIDQEVLDVYNKGIDEVGFDKYPFEIWISKDDKMIRKMAFSVTSGETNIESSLVVNDYNKPVDVQKPEGAQSIMEIISNYFGQNPMFTLPTAGLEPGTSL